MTNSFTFNGIRKSYIGNVTVGRPVFAPVQRNLITVPGMAGAYLESSDTLVRQIPVTIYLQGDDVNEYQRNGEDLASWLVTKEPGELIFDDDPNRIYYAIVEGSLNLDEIVTFGMGTITFICPDPYKYGAEQTVTSLTDVAAVDNGGSAESFPVITCTINKNTTYVAVGNGTELNMIGEPSSIDAVVFEPKTVLLNDGMTSTTGWGAAGFTPEGATKAGTITTNGNVLLPSSYGTGSAWHGPALQKSLSEQLQDFIVEFTFNFSSAALTEIGKIQLYGLDATNKKTFMLGMADYWSGREMNMPEGYLYTTAEARKAVLVRNAEDIYEDFYGYMRVTRIGKNIEFYIKKVDGSGKMLAEKKRTYYDSKNEYQQPLSGLGLHFAQHGTNTAVSTNNASHITVTKINQNSGVPYIARSGDVVVFDHQTNIITINGEDATSSKAFIGQYFSVKPGVNGIVAEPADSVSEIEVRWQPAWH